MAKEESDLLNWSYFIEYATLGSWIEKSSISKEILCSNADNNVHTIIYEKKLNFSNARLICNQLGGSLYYPKVLLVTISKQISSFMLLIHTVKKIFNSLKHVICLNEHQKNKKILF